MNIDIGLKLVILFYMSATKQSQMEARKHFEILQNFVNQQEHFDHFFNYLENSFPNQVLAVDPAIVHGLPVNDHLTVFFVLSYNAY